jgi:hypothetical protein
VTGQPPGSRDGTSEQTAAGERPSDSWKHDPRLEGGRADTGDNRTLDRRTPIEHSDSGLASRDYRPLVGGPKLISSWLLGVPPSDRGDEETWEVVSREWVTLQRNVLSAPHLGTLDSAPTYLVVCGRCHVAEGTTLTIQLSNRYLSGKPYETTVTVNAEHSTPFCSPTVEFTPDRGVYEEADGRHFPEYVLQAKVSSGTGYVNAGTNVQLWSG